MAYPNAVEAYRTDQIKSITTSPRRGNIYGQDGYWSWWSAVPAAAADSGDSGWWPSRADDRHRRGRGGGVGGCAGVMRRRGGPRTTASSTCAADIAPAPPGCAPRTGGAETRPSRACRVIAAGVTAHAAAYLRLRAGKLVGAAVSLFAVLCHQLLPVPDHPRRPGAGHDPRPAGQHRAAGRAAHASSGSTCRCGSSSPTTAGRRSPATSARRTSSRAPVIDQIAEASAGRRCCWPAAPWSSQPRSGSGSARSAAWRHGSPADRVNTGVALTLWSVPSFWLGLLLIIVLSVGVGPIPGLFPTGGMESGRRDGLRVTSSTSRTTWCCRWSPWSRWSTRSTCW